MKLDRLMGILTTLLQSGSVTAPQLAQKFEVTRRTIGRDIDALCMAGIPVITKQGGNGGISLAEGYKLDKSVLTADEMQTLLAALKGIGTVSSGTKMERMLDKLARNSDSVVSLKENMIINLSSHYKSSLSEKIAAIKNAISKENLIAFDYYSEKGQSRRRIEPYCITFQWSAWYVFGYCLDRKDFRLFKLNRLWELEVLSSAFLPREIPAGSMDFADRFPDENRVVVLFDPSVLYQLIDSYGRDCFTVLPDGFLRFESGYTNRSYMVSWILGFGDKAKVLEPVDMAEEIREIAKKMVGTYNEHDKQLSCSSGIMEEKKEDHL
jgi:predicted DNA-binding transcriptional regulator YafY